MAEVKIYTTPTCPYCLKAKEYFAKKGIKYTEYNVAQDKDALREMTELSGGRSVPVIAVNGEVMLGFNQERLDKLLGEEKKDS
ncbi:MAG: glutaredoxin family protein [Candidatus Brocadiales bacterium]|nr:glutaredoxin family protein [Candidatus Bathyanammoxibius sp.]MCQ4574919.1 glutaredoxin family protein [Candidatus Bathyanammoxibius amoris]